MEQDKSKNSGTDQAAAVRKKNAVALAYNPDEAAPKIIASGRGLLAEKIIDAAKDASVPVHKDVRLANTLSKLEIGDYIPQELYDVVAEILIFVDGMDKIKQKVTKGQKGI